MNVLQPYELHYKEDLVTRAQSYIIGSKFCLRRFSQPAADVPAPAENQSDHPMIIYLSRSAPELVSMAVVLVRTVF